MLFPSAHVRPATYISGPVLVETCAESDLVVLNHEYDGKILYRREVHALVTGGGASRSVPDPSHRHSVFTALFERKGDSRHDRHARAHVADRLNHTLSRVPGMQVPATTGRVRRREVCPEEVGHGHAHHVASACVSYHRADHVASSIERRH
jgi:hypothetical protein